MGTCRTSQETAACQPRAATLHRGQRVGASRVRVRVRVRWLGDEKHCSGEAWVQQGGEGFCSARSGRDERIMMGSGGSSGRDEHIKSGRLKHPSPSPNGITATMPYAICPVPYAICPMPCA